MLLQVLLAHQHGNEYLKNPLQKPPDLAWLFKL